MNRLGWFFFVGYFLLQASSFASSVRALAFDENDAMLSKFLLSKTTVLENKAMGKIERRFGNEGILAERLWQSAAVPGVVEKFFVERGLQTRWIKETWFRSELISKEVSFFSRSGALEKRELYWGRGSQDQFDRKSEDIPNGDGSISTTLYALSDAGWTAVGSSKTEGRAFEKPRPVEKVFEMIKPVSYGTEPVETAFPKRSSLPKSYAPYIECLVKGKGASSSPSCFDERIREAQLKGFTDTVLGSYVAFGDLKCVQNGILSLPNGYRIDLKTCAEPLQINRIEDALDQVVSSRLACLKKYNPDLAVRFALTVSEKRPLIKCLPGGDLPKFLNCAGKDNCRAKVRDASAAFYEFAANEIQLVKVDPGVSLNYPPSELASVLFHETLHAVRVPMNDSHAKDPDLKDAIFGCERVCQHEAVQSGLPVQIYDAVNNSASQEGCSSCVMDISMEVDLKNSKAMTVQSYLSAIDRAREQRRPLATKLCSKFLPVKESMKVAKALTLHQYLSVCLDLGLGAIPPWLKIEPSRLAEWKAGFCNADFSNVTIAALAEVCPMEGHMPGNEKRFLERCREPIRAQIYEWLWQAVTDGGPETPFGVDVEALLKHYQQFQKK